MQNFGEVQNDNECYQKHIEGFLVSDQVLGSCDSDQLTVSWTCRTPGEKTDWITKGVKCDGVVAKATGELVTSLDSLLATNSLGNEPGGIGLKPCKTSNSLGLTWHPVEPPKKVETVESLNAEKVRVHYKTKEEMCQAINKFAPGAVLERQCGKFNFSIDIFNDDAGLGSMKKLFGSYGKKSNDKGHTHATCFSGDGSAKDGYHITVEYCSDLYTSTDPMSRRIDRNGITHINQHALEKNVWSLMIDDKDKKNPLYYKAGIGWMELNTEKLGNFFTSSMEQQRQFHDLLIAENKTWAYKPHFVPDPTGNKSGMFVDVGVGKETDIFTTDTVRIKTRAELSGRLSSVPGTSSAKVEGEITAYYQPVGWKTAFAATATATAERVGSQNFVSHSVLATYGGESFNCGVGVEQRRQEKGPNAYRHDNDNNPMWKMACRKSF